MTAIAAGPASETLPPPTPARSRPRPASRTLLLGGLIVAAATALPAVYLFIRSADAGAGGIWDILSQSRTIGLLLRTIALTAAVTTSAVVVAVPLAWLTAKSDLPGRRVWAVLLALPLVVPSYVGGYALVAALGPKGIVQGWLDPLGVQRLPSLYGFPGAWLALTLFTYPYLFLTVRAVLRGMDPALEEASLGLGRSRAETFRRVVLPQMRPAIAAGSLLVALYTLHDFGAVSLLRYDSFTRAIYVSYSGSFDRTRAAVLSLMLVALAVIVVAAEVRSRGRAAYHRTHGTAARRAPPVPLGAWKLPALVACGGVLALALGLPVGVITYWLVRSARAAEPLGPTLTAGANSLKVSAAAAAVAVAASWPVAMLAVRHRGRFSRLVEGASFVGFALPGIVVALSLVFFGIRLAPALYQTLLLLVFAYCVLFLPQSVGAVRASLLQVNPNLEDAARALGSRQAAVLRRVVLPLVRPGVAAAAALVFLTAMKELPATLLLAPAGFRTLATEMWSATNAAQFDRAAPPALMLVLLSSLPLALLVARETRASP
jgi:iron(III) transport system permease protein